MTTLMINIDGREVDFQEGETVLQAARRAGLDIPTLCFLEKCGPLTSCQVCLVKTNGKLVPACGTKAAPGMVIESETEEVHEARRTALELLFSDHIGDCLSPCHRLCPLLLNIPVMIRQIESGQLAEAIVTVRQALPLPSVLGRLCHHPCEQGCRRGNWDDPAAIREMERFVADHDQKSSEPHLPPRRPATGKTVAIIGAGPTGLSAAYFLARQGHTVTVADRHDQAGGGLRNEISKGNLPREVFEAEIAQFVRLGIEFKLGVELGRHVTLEGLSRGFDAILLAVGEIAKGEGDPLGIALAATGIKSDPNTCRTDLLNVFAAGAAVKPVRQLVRALTEGRAAADCVHQFLSGQPVRRLDKPFSSIMGRLEKIELKAFLQGASPNPTVAPPCDACAGFTKTEASTEAARCLHCDCRSSGHCALQHYAQVYGADANRFRAERRPFEQHLQPGGVIFEPGKCIVCGICVKLTELAQEELGLTYVGRGFDVRVATPFHRTIEEGLQKVAQECVEQCPTGALVLREKASDKAAVADR